VLLPAWQEPLPKKPLIVFDNKGIQNITDLGNISIKWDEVIGAQIEADKRGNKILVVSLKNIDNIIGNMKRNKKRVANINTKKYGSPLVIQRLFADFDPDETVEFINARAGANVTAN
jgi:hypothetical protein